MSERGLARFFTHFILVILGLLVGSVAGWVVSRERTPSLLPREEAVQGEGDHSTRIEYTSLEGSPEVGRSYEDSLRPGEAGEGVNKSRENAIVRAANTVGPCVVSINVFQTQIVETASPFDEFWRDYFFPYRYEREVQSLGSGFLISSKGHILTNEHVVYNASRILVTLEDGREYEASIVGTDARTDLALLQIEASDLPVTPLGDSDDLLLGEWVIAIGNPFGYLLGDPKPSVTVGVVSALERDVKPERGEERVFANMIQTDASINPGNSGGPLVDSNGLVVGVNTFIFTKSGGSLGIGFAVPINRAKRIVKDVVQYGKVRWPWIGIHVQELTANLREGMRIDERQRVAGIIVADIDPMSPGERSGVNRGDIITALNGKQINSVFDWEGEILDVAAEAEIVLTVMHRDNLQNLSLVTESLPTDVAERIESEMGIVLTDLTPRIRSQLGVANERGAVVVDVKDKELREDGGILPFDVILKLNNQNIDSAEAAAEQLDNLKRGSRNLLVIERQGKLLYRSLITR
jgi:serine protease Do